MTGQMVGRLLFFAKKCLALGSSKLWLSALVRRGVAAGVEHVPVLRRIGPVETIIDIGANRGQFCLAARGVSRESKIFAFEPLPIEAERFCLVFRHDRAITLFRSGIGSEDRQETMHVSARADSSSLFPIGETQERLFKGTGEVRTEAVSVRKLSNILRKDQIRAPALLKIDVQGYELEVLRGSESLLSAIKWVYVECSFVNLYVGQPLAHEVIDWLSHRRFRFAGVYNVQYDRYGGAIQADILFESE